MLRNAFSFILGAYFLIFLKQLCVHFVICSVAVNTGKLKLSFIKQKTTARFNEILTCNNNALLSELMAFILYANHFEVTSPLLMGAPQKVILKVTLTQ